MNIGEIAQLVTSIATLAVALGIRVGVKQVHESTNGKMDKLLQLTASASHAEGLKEGEAKSG
jgi:hypothetical protein